MLVVAVHVVVAILGVGQVAGLAVLASSAPSGSWTAIQRLARGTTWSLGIMLATGVLIEYLSGGPFHTTVWFRLSFVGMILLGAASGTVRRALRKRESVGDERTLTTVARTAWLMCGITAVVAALMELKPW